MRLGEQRGGMAGYVANHLHCFPQGSVFRVSERGLGIHMGHLGLFILMYISVLLVL